ncbi:hypothetical protein RvY_10802 [Ramazzottius varieornatus]|uniref:SMB domain-containing protein n=1 Tax=Ramazzottius varieornatus TaxID=947166 RepID=A0A1D1VLS8_RAMVA|nr:hypothetical protein RvY_10802 [Ramazzottius varieornatus]
MAVYLFPYLLLFFGLFLEFHTVRGLGFSGIPGLYCTLRTPGCCTLRNDTCSVPIMGTACYCDQFCDRRAEGEVPDCCPDFYEHCRGEIREYVPETTTTTFGPWTLPSTRVPLKEPEIVRGCWSEGTFHLVSTRLQRNCNECFCQKISPDEEVFEFLCDSKVCLIQDDLIQRVNANHQYYSWSASNYSFFYGLTLADGYLRRLGTFKPEVTVSRMHEIRIDKNAVLPDRFDARERWPGLIQPVRDQGDCAASWAFSTSELASDRIAIMTNGEKNERLSAQHLLSCNRNKQEGCKGGHLDRAWWFLRKKGIVSEECYPYKVEPAASGKCEVGSVDLIAVDSCPSGSSQKDLWEMTPPYRIANKTDEIKYEIYRNGPVQAAFRVYPSFFLYKSGVYQSDSDEQSDFSLGAVDDKRKYHSVRIIGWGKEFAEQREINYWLCTNSWGVDWGEQGTFRIAMDDKGVGVESFVIGVWGSRRGGAPVESTFLRSKRRYHRQRQRLIKRKHTPRQRPPKQVRARVRQDMRKIEKMFV